MSKAKHQPLPCGGMGPNLVPTVHIDPEFDFLRYSGQAMHFGDQGLVAVGLGKEVTIVDAGSSQVVQSLSWHSHSVTSVRWLEPTSSAVAPASCKLLSGDCGGNIAVWDVSEGVVLRSFATERGLGIVEICLNSPKTTYALILLENGELVSLDTTGQREGFHRVSKPSTRSMAVIDCPLSPNPTVGLIGESAITVWQAGTDEFRSYSKTEWSFREVCTVTPKEFRGAAFSHAVFSHTYAELMFVACGNVISLFDWKLKLVLVPELVWCSASSTFRQLFPAWCHLPSVEFRTIKPQVFLFTLTSDAKLAAWLSKDDPTQSYRSSSIDARGSRSPGREVKFATQSSFNAFQFAVLLTDGFLLVWQYEEEYGYWSNDIVLELLPPMPIQLVPISPTELIYSASSGRLCHMEIITGTLKKSLSLTNGRAIVDFITYGKPYLYVTTSYQNNTQIAAIDLARGELAFLLRPPGLKGPSDSTRIKSVTIEQTTNKYLLLLFHNSSFEVWNLKTRLVVHTHSGAGLSYVCWGVPGITQHDPKLPTGVPLATLKSNGEIHLLHISNDGASSLHEPHLSLPAVSLSNVVQAFYADCLFVCVEHSTINVTRGNGEKFSSANLIKLHNSPIVHTAVCPAHCLPSGVNSRNVLLAVVFGNGSLGVWDAVSRARKASTDDTRLAIMAVSACWMQDAHVVVALAGGGVAVLGIDLVTTNSAFEAKSLLRAIHSPALLPPKLTTALQLALQFGHASGEEIVAKLRLWRTQVPDPVESTLSQGVIASRAFHTASYFGLKDVARFWATVIGSESETACDRDAVVPFQHRTTKSLALLPDAPLEASGIDIMSLPRSLLPYAGSFVGETRETLLLRLAVLCKLRQTVLSEVFDSTTGDSVEARVLTSRDLVICGNRQAASDVLIQANPMLPSYRDCAARACLIAATVEGAVSEPLVIASKRAAAMLLANGDVEGAVENFGLIHEHYEAALALASRGRWIEAARHIKIANADESQRAKLLHDWVEDCARNRQDVWCATILMTLNCPHEALASLVTRPERTDVAGLFAVWLENVLKESNTQVDDRKSISSPDRAARGGEEWEESSPSTWPGLKSLLRDILEQYLYFVRSHDLGSCIAESLHEVQQRLKTG